MEATALLCFPIVCIFQYFSRTIGIEFLGTLSIFASLEIFKKPVTLECLKFLMTVRLYECQVSLVSIWVLVCESFKLHSQPSCAGWLRHNLRNGQSFMLNSHHEGIHNSKRSQYENLIMMKINLQEPEERRYC